MDSLYSVCAPSFFDMFAGFRSFVLIQGIKRSLKHHMPDEAGERLTAKKSALEPQRQKHKMNLNLTKNNKYCNDILMMETLVLQA